ncbi:helix-turn-helix transcriptional regulator [Streptomyces sp. NPDC020875]|uniref:helix-turn-helix transcriptional regulator n=1 Tax=Streptomyces sp. NPDC020875 TaxID=3154898 RepID=UPI0033EABC4D
MTEEPPPAQEGTASYRPPGPMVLGAWLRQRRQAAGLTTDAVAAAAGRGWNARRVEHAESGRAALDGEDALALASAVGVTDETGRKAVARLAVRKDPDITDKLPGAQERLEAVEALAERMVAVALGPLWPRQWAWDPPVPAAPGQPGPRSWPACPVTLVIQDQVLEHPVGCRAVSARRLTALADRAEATGLDVRVVSYLAPAVTDAARIFGPLGSAVTLPGGRELYVSEGYDPFYRAPHHADRGLLDALLAVSADGTDATTALRTAAARHAAARCPRPGPGCACPAAPPERPVPGPRKVIAIVRRADGQILLAPGPDGILRPPTTQILEDESPAQSAVRAVWRETAHAVVITHDLPAPAKHSGHYVLCAAPGPGHRCGRVFRWAPADTVPGLPSLPPGDADDDNHAAGEGV